MGPETDVSTKPFSLAVYLLVRNRNERFLALRRSQDSKRFPGLWDFPGGKVNLRERIDEAVRREVFEETGLQVAVEHVVGVTELELEKLRVAVLIFEGRKMTGQVRLNEEHNAYAWVPLPKLQSLKLPNHLHSFVEAYCAQQKNSKETDSKGVA